MRSDWKWRILIIIAMAMALTRWADWLARVEAATQTLYVQSNRANFRESPELEADTVLDVLQRGTRVTVFEPEGAWYPTQLKDGRTGWMHQSTLGAKPPPAMSTTSAPRLPLVRFGILQDGGTWGDALLPVFQKEIRELLSPEYTVRFPAAMTVKANWTLQGVRAAMNRLLSNPNVDMILAFGVLASHEAGQRRRLSKPVFAPFVINAQLQTIPLTKGSSGIHNLSYLAFPSNVVRDLRAFLNLVPFKTFAMLVSKGITEALPQLSQSIQRRVRDLGLRVEIVPVEATADSALAALTDDIEAVYAMPLQQLQPGEFQRLVDGLMAKQLPSFSLWGRNEVEQGLLFSLSNDTNMPRLARRVALNVQRTLLGEDPKTFPVTFSRGERMTLNMATARAISLSPPWAFLTQMDVLNEEADLSRQLSLAAVVREVVNTNLDLQALDRSVAAGVQTIRAARADLLPQLTASIQGRVIDDDRANVAAPERALSGSLELSQLIYAEPTWANLSIQRSLQRSREESRQVTLLDVVLETTTTYLNVLSAKTAERIQRDNLNLTRTNLELARVRHAIGVARPNEVLRWDNQIANDRRQVINAFSQRQQVEIGLNRVLHRPLEERFTTVEPSLTDPQLLTNFAQILPYVDNPRYFAILREFMVLNGLEAAPELRQVDSQIAAQERTLLAEKRAFYTPTVSLQSALTGIERDGVGAANNPDNHVNWEAGVQASLPLYTGGSRSATRQRAHEELAQLQLQREAAAERIAATIRTTLYAAGSSYANINLAKDAADAARKNLELVSDAYGRGAVSILDLLDAQREALQANLDAANTVYVYLTNLMQMQRAVGRFDFFVSASGRSAWFERLDAFFRDNGARIKRDQ